MSVVANVLCVHTSWVAYDGRASRDGEIISESVEKAVMVNRFVCVGYTGVLELAQVVMLNLQEHVVGISDMKSNIVAEAIKLILQKLDVPKGFYANFLVTGINTDGIMASYTLGSQCEISAHIPYSNNFETVVLCSDANKLQLDSYVIKRIKKFGFSNTSIKNAMQEYIGDMSEIDTSVNRYCRFLELHT